MREPDPDVAVKAHWERIHDKIDMQPGFAYIWDDFDNETMWGLYTRGRVDDAQEYAARTVQVQPCP